MLQIEITKVGEGKEEKESNRWKGLGRDLERQRSRLERPNLVRGSEWEEMRVHP